MVGVWKLENGENILIENSVGKKPFERGSHKIRCKRYFSKFCVKIGNGENILIENSVGKKSFERGSHKIRCKRFFNKFCVKVLTGFKLYAATCY